MIKHIVFDFDGTIADTKAIAYEVYFEVANQNHIQPINQKAFRLLEKMSIRQRIKMMRIPWIKILWFLKQARHLFFTRIKDAPIFEGMSSLLDDLDHQGFEVYMLSSNHDDVIEAFMKRHHITHFDHIVGKVSLFGKAKALKRFMKKHQLKPHEFVYVGDEIRDIEACQKVGVKIIAVSWGYDHKELLETANPDFLCDDVNALSARIMQLKDGVIK
jgi:phosphoglycolate phosphatase